MRGSYQTGFLGPGVEAELLDRAFSRCDEDDVDREVVLVLGLNRLHHQVGEANQLFLDKRKKIGEFLKQNFCTNLRRT